MSNATTNQSQSGAATDPAPLTGDAVSTKEASKTDEGADKGATQEQLQQTGPGPKVLRSHFRGMPKQWEKNQPPKKDGD